MCEMRHLLAVGMVFCAIFALGLAAKGDTGRGRHRQLYAVPAPGEVKIDANLDDWDLSGQIEMFVVEPTRDTMNARFAVMYDEDALYVSGDVRDPSPMMNRNDPAAAPGRGWNADSCQFRIVVDADAGYPETESVWPYRAARREGRELEDTRDDLLHITMWYYTDGEHPAMTIAKGMTYRSLREGWHQGLVPLDEYEAAYVKHDDGRGYTFEYRLPWSLLGAKRPLKGGDLVAGTVQFNWSTPEGYTTAGTSAWSCDVLLKPGFPFQNADIWGKVIFYETGNVPRELVLEGVPRDRPLPLEFTYELPADGEATVQLFKEDGTAMRILVPQQERLGGINTERWDGLDDSGNILPAGEYRWRGIYFEEPLRPQYRFSVHNSGRPPYPTDDGKGGWGADHGTPQDLTALGDNLLMVWNAAEYGSGTIRTNIDGRKQWGMQSGGTYIATDGTRYYTAGDQGFTQGIDVNIFDVNNGRPATLENGIARFPAPAGGEVRNNRPTGLLWHNNMLYVSYGARGIVALFSTEDGELKATWEMPVPGRMAMRPDGSLAVISGNRVVNIKDGQATPWLTSQLDSPTGIAVASDGTAYVANRGALQNISVFSADGTYQRSIGKEGGRPLYGTYDAGSILEPGGVTLDARGRLWVAETLDSPKRISVWDTRTGQNINEFFGASGYMAYGTIDPARPNEIYGHGVLWEIDWDTYTTHPKTTIWRKTEPNAAPPADSGPSRFLTAEDGNQYMWGHHRIGNTIHSIMLRRDGDVFKPFMALFNTNGSERTGIAVLDDDHVAFPRRHPGLPPHYTPAYFWYDANNDQTVQPEELTPLPGGDFPAYYRTNFTWVEPDLTVRLATPHLWRPVGVNEHGMPVYDPLNAERAPAYGGTRSVTSLGDGSIATLRHIAVVRGHEGPALVRWSPDGQMLWNYPNLIDWRGAINLPIVQSGRLWGMTGTMGNAGDFFAHQTYFGPNQIFRTDGMYVGTVLKDTRIGGRGAYEGMPEGQFGSFVKLEIDGKERYFTIGGGGDVRVWEVHGLESIRDLPGGTYVHTEEQVAQARAALAEYEAQLAGRREVHIVAGGLQALDDAPAATREIEGNRRFEARLAYDANNLYVRFNVTTPHGLVNGVGDPHILFRGGNLLDIQIAADPNADPDRTTPAPGDQRLLITRMDGAPYAVHFQPKVAGYEGEPIVLTSPTGTEPFDRITVAREVGLEYEATDSGFIAMVTIPKTLIALDLAPDKSIKLDLGYVFGNSDGTRAAVRAYLFNNSFSANVVDDIPHESRLEPGEWGEATIK